MGRWLLGLLLVSALVSPALAVTLSPRVIDGTTANAGNHPFMATVWALNGNQADLCGGVLVAPDWVLTAAHCAVKEGATPTQPFKPQAFEVYLGQQHLLAACDPSVQGACSAAQQRAMRRVDALHVYAGYRGESTNFDGDIALLHLTTATASQSTGQPLSLATDLQKQRLIRQWRAGGHHNLRVMGWGKTAARGGSLAGQLQYADLDFEPAASCGSALDLSVQPGQICAIDPAGNKDTCNGDSGGPLMVQQDGETYLLGLTSFGDIKCAQQGVPSVYTSVPHYLNWIETQINQTQVPAAKVVLLKASIPSGEAAATRAGSLPVRFQVENASDSRSAHDVGVLWHAASAIKVVDGGGFVCGVPGRRVHCTSTKTLAPGATLVAQMRIESASLPTVDERLDVRLEAFADEFNVYRDKSSLAALYFENSRHLRTSVRATNANVYTQAVAGQIAVANLSAAPLADLRLETVAGGGVALSYHKQACQPECDAGPLKAGASQALHFSGTLGAANNAVVVSAYDAGRRTATELKSYLLPARLMQTHVKGRVAPPPVGSGQPIATVSATTPRHGSSGGSLGWWALAGLLLLGAGRRG